MTKEELAKMLNGREIGEEISATEAMAANNNNLVVVYGASDDLMEFEGAICDEIGWHNGGTAYLSNGKLLVSECEDDCCPYFKKKLKGAKTIRAIWGKDGYSWIYETDIPHATFDIFDDKDKYCRGIVFSLGDIK
jgi:hypothetical protein